MQQPVRLAVKFGEKCLHIFMQSPQNVSVLCGTECYVWPDEFFVNNPLHVKKSDEHALDFARYLLAFFSLGELELPVYCSFYLPDSLSNHC
jgi:hypothetical protein